MEAFRRLEQKVLIAYDPKQLEGVNVPPNVLALDWVPQNDVLGHNNTKLFVTHSGKLKKTKFSVQCMPVFKIVYGIHRGSLFTTKYWVFTKFAGLFVKIKRY